MLAFDVDGVVLDLETRILDVAEDVLGTRPLRLNGRYRFDERFGLTGDDIARIWERFNARQLWADLPPFPGAVEAIREIRGLGIPVAFVTGIPATAHAQRARNLERLGINDYVLECTGSPVTNKRPVLERLGARAFVDDRLGHLRDAAAVVEHLAWIDLGDDQDFTPTEVPHARRHPSLADWFDSHQDWLASLRTAAP